MDFAQNRYFAAKHGRFTSVDPLAASASSKNPQTLNRYTYALNSPYKFTDPLGLAATQHCWGNLCSTYDADEQAERGEKAESMSQEADVMKCSYCLVVDTVETKVFKGEGVKAADGSPLMVDDGNGGSKQAVFGFGAGSVNAISVVDEKGMVVNPEDRGLSLSETVSVDSCQPEGACKDAKLTKADSPVPAFPDGYFYDIQGVAYATQADYDAQPADTRVVVKQTLTLTDKDGKVLDKKQFAVTFTKTDVTRKELELTQSKPSD